MATTTFNIRMDESLKQRVDETASAIGLTAAAAFNVFARQFVAYGGFPFEVVIPTPVDRAYTEEMDRRFESMLKGEGTVHELLEE